MRLLLLMLAAGLLAIFAHPFLGLCQDGPADLQHDSAWGALRELSAEDIQGINELIRLIVLENLPHEFEETKNWGGTKAVWTGLDVSQDGLRLRTKRRTKEVNHGTWEKYRAWLIEPEKELSIGLEHLESEVGKGVRFELVVHSKLGAAARRSEWQRGIQLYSLSAEAEARLRLRLCCRVRFVLDTAVFPPAVQLEPAVSEAHLELTDVRIHRISKLDGPIVKQTGKALREVLQHELDRRSPKLVSSINRAIERHRGQLRFSLRDMVERGW